MSRPANSVKPPKAAKPAGAERFCESSVFMESVTSGWTCLTGVMLAMRTPLGCTSRADAFPRCLDRWADAHRSPGARHYLGAKYFSRIRPRIWNPRSLAWTGSRMNQPRVWSERRMYSPQGPVMFTNSTFSSAARRISRLR